jgi:hypothetical protein
MTRFHQTDPKAERQIHVKLGDPDTDSLRPVAGSSKDALNNKLITQAIAAQWTPKGATDEQHGDSALVTLLAMMELAPRDGVEGMLAAQIVAQHGMAMEMARRAMLPDQPYEFAAGMRKASIQASRACVELLDALDRRRGKRGRQNIKVTHLHVSGDARAVIGNFNAAEGGGGDGDGIDGEPYAAGHLAGPLGAGAILPPLRSANPERQPVPVPGDAERPMQDARRQKHRAKPRGA